MTQESDVGEMIEIEALDGTGRFATYRALPQDEVPRAAMIVIQEIFGVNAGIRRKADDWADQGCLALAPDMFWRFAPRYEADPDVPAQFAEAFELRHQFDIDKGVADVEAVIRTARAMLGQGKVGVVGFCMGGRVAFLSATRTDVDASVGYYGGMIDQALDEAHGIARPLLLHYGAADEHIGAEAMAKVHAALDGNPRVTIHDYQGAGHGFADTFGKRRQQAAAQEADARTRAFFAEHLG